MLDYHRGWQPGWTLFRATDFDGFVIVHYIRSDKRDAARNLSNIDESDLSACRLSAVRFVDELLSRLTSGTLET